MSRQEAAASPGRTEAQLVRAHDRLRALAQLELVEHVGPCVLTVGSDRTGVWQVGEGRPKPPRSRTIPIRRPDRRSTMINDQAQKLLVQQVAHELSAHQTYMGISLYFTRESLNGWARFFHEQAVEEAGHGWKIINYLIDNEVEFALPQVKGAVTNYKSAREAVEVAQASERRVTAQFETLANVAREAKDNRTLQFLYWFIEEQVEEERTMTALLDLIDSGINLFQAEAHIESVSRA